MHVEAWCGDLGRFTAKCFRSPMRTVRHVACRQTALIRDARL